MAASCCGHTQGHALRPHRIWARGHTGSRLAERPAMVTLTGAWRHARRRSGPGGGSDAKMGGTAQGARRRGHLTVEHTGEVPASRGGAGEALAAR